MVKALIEDDKKRCNSCGEWKTFDQYGKAKTCQMGLKTYCFKCTNEKAIAKSREAGCKPKRLAVIDGDNMKLCLICNTKKELSGFSAQQFGLGGYASRCKACTNLYSAEWREENRDKLIEYHANLRKEDPSIITNIRVRKHELNTGTIVVNDGTVDKDFVIALKATEICHYCGSFTELSQRTLDHKTPLSRGGIHSKSNAVMSCRSCNCKKQAMTEEEFFSKFPNKQYV